MRSGLLALLLLALAGTAQAETVRASWYGIYHQGRLTANGERFNRFAMTAAHRTLPLGTIIRVSNPATGAVLYLRINDRGPYIAGRGLDVSERAAELLGFHRAGTALLEMVVVPR